MLKNIKFVNVSSVISIYLSLYQSPHLFPIIRLENRTPSTTTNFLKISHVSPTNFSFMGLDWRYFYLENSVPRRSPKDEGWTYTTH